jgi:F-type H+-transporting ATPase subunit b
MELLKLLSANELVVQFLNFFLLLFLLRVFFWKKMLGLLDARREKIIAENKRIEDARLETERIKASYEDELKAFRKAAQEKMNEAIHTGRHVAEGIEKKARNEAEKIIEAGRAEIRKEVARAKSEMKDQVVDIAIEVARNMIEEKLTEADDRKLAETFLKELDKA